MSLMDRMCKQIAGFTLIELMIVVAIIAILAAIALPDFMRMQLIAKRSEGIMLLDNIRISETMYFTDYDTYAEDPIASKLGAYDILPLHLKYYTNRNCISEDAHFGYRCTAIAFNLDHDPTPDVLILKIGDAGNANSVNGYVFPEGISVYVDDSIL